LFVLGAIFKGGKMNWNKMLIELSCVCALLINVESAKAADVPSITAGWYHTCILTDGGEVKCWGNNAAGQIGDGTFDERHNPTNVIGLPKNISSIVSGASHNCAITPGGGLKCWGANDWGRLGDGTTTYRSTPVDVVGLTSGVISVAGGDEHTCALTSTGGVKCWGVNDFGQLGDGTNTWRSTPVNVVGLNSGVAAITAGRGFSCAILNSSGLKCWGEGQFGQIGDGSATSKNNTPVDVSGLSTGVVSVTGGAWHACALTTNGGIKCWGRNDSGQVGDGTNIERHTPVNVSGLSGGASIVEGGWQHTCAVTSGGAKCWGSNYFGQLGDGTGVGSNIPVNVSGLTNGVMKIGSGGGGYDAEHSCAIINTGRAKCWGNNVYGQLGDGTTTQRLAPVDAIGLSLPLYLPFIIK
jgi:alpha-tubulin suppressor-like RCC1 family protein